jgi:SAM-dependent methyltransferase
MSRETDQDWAELGDIEPYFAVLSQDRFRMRNLTEETLSEFWASGEADVAFYLKSIKDYFGEVRIADALDFGCGVGRLARAMAAHAGSVVGVDVSPGMLEEARKHAPPNLEFVLSLPDRTFDWINSIIVFQHIPPERGHHLFNSLLDRLRPGGAFSIQTTFFKDATYLPAVFERLKGGSWDGEKLTNALHEESGLGSILMYDYDYTKLLISAVLHRVGNIHLQHTYHGGCHGFVMYGQRGEA